MTALDVPVSEDSRTQLDRGIPPSPPPVASRERPPFRLGRASVVLGLGTALALWAMVFVAVLSPLQEHSAQGHLYDRFRVQLAEETAPLAEPIATGRPVALINSPAAHMRNLVVLEGTTSRLLKDGPGHLAVTPLPGQMGDSVIFGRSLAYGAPFVEVPFLRKGEAIGITTGQGSFLYRVEGVRSDGDPLPAPLKKNQSRITFVTSSGGSWTTAGVPTGTAYADAILIHGTAQPVPPGLPSTVGKASQAMQGDSSGTVALIFWLEALFAAGVALIWCWRRWGGTQTWVVGSPVLMATLWGATDAAMRFLPNLV